MYAVLTGLQTLGQLSYEIPGTYWPETYPANIWYISTSKFGLCLGPFNVENPFPMYAIGFGSSF